jgi:phenylalanine-4-hydroxylase
MNDPNFNQMSKTELKTYLLKHKNDSKAFSALMEKINADQNRTFYSLEEEDTWKKLIERKAFSIPKLQTKLTIRLCQNYQKEQIEERSRRDFRLTG